MSPKHRMNIFLQLHSLLNTQNDYQTGVTNEYLLGKHRQRELKGRILPMNLKLPPTGWFQNKSFITQTNTVASHIGLLSVIREISSVRSNLSESR